MLAIEPIADRTKHHLKKFLPGGCFCFVLNSPGNSERYVDLIVAVICL